MGTVNEYASTKCPLFGEGHLVTQKIERWDMFGPIVVGKDGTGYDVTFYGTTSGDFLLFDEGADTLELEDITLSLMDSTVLSLGDSDDVTLNFDGSNLELEAAATGEGFLIGTSSKTINITHHGTYTVGVNDTGYDVKLFGATASAYLLWDEDEDALVTAGVAHLHLSGIDADAGEGVGSVIQMGISGTPLTSSEDETELVSCYGESSGKNIYGMRMQVEKTSATNGAPRALTLRSILSHASGFAPQGANSVDARVTLEAGASTNTGISGEMHAMESQCRVDTATRSLQGTYAAHKFTNKFGANNTMPSTTFFLRFIDDGSVYTPYMFDFRGLTEGAARCIDADTTALDGIATTYKLRVLDPAGNIGYIPIMGALT